MTVAALLVVLYVAGAALFLGVEAVRGWRSEGVRLRGQR